MAITKRAKAIDPKAIEAFLGGPDHTPPAAPEPEPPTPPKGFTKGNKRQITITVHPALLDRVDEMAERLGQTRAGFIGLALNRVLDGEFFK